MARRALACRSAAALAALAAAIASPTRAQAQTHDPTLVWSTFETAHFRVHYYQGMREIAERVASIGEGIYTRIGTLVGNPRPGQTDIALTDQTDEANGSATAFPYNAIRLNLAAPEDLSTIGDYDDWLQTLVTHEYTHLAQFDNVSGVPAIINAIFGHIYPPNQVVPHWIAEGIAVASETRNTSGGRLRSSVWDMYMRADALADHLATLDQVTTGPNRWPHGDIWYLYGSHFIEYILERFGEHVLADISTTYGGQLVPFGLNRALQRSTGFTYEQLYPQFLAAMRARYTRMRDELTAAGLEEGERLTFQNEQVMYPRFYPGTNTVVYESSDGQSHPQLRTIDAGHAGGPLARARDGEWIAAFSGFAFNRAGDRMILSDIGFYRGIYFYRELYDRRTHLGSNGALESPDGDPITDGARAFYPDIAPDDDHVAFTVNHRGTMALFEMALADRRPRQVLNVRRYEQVFTPRYSPDGRSIVFSHWQREGFRDVRLLDRETGAVRDLTHDRALDMQPVFSPDGRYVVFASDRTGIFNLYAYELATGALRQITNVVHGAFMPAISPDGRTLVYAGYHALGFDLYRLPFDPSRWREPMPARVRDGTRPPTPPVAGRHHPYDPWDTLRPRLWSAELSGDGYGEQVAITSNGSDIVGNHSWNARLGATLRRADPTFELSYGFGGLRPNFSIHFYRRVESGRFHVGLTDTEYPQERWGGETSLSVSFPALFLSQSVGITYEAQYVGPIGEGVPFLRYVDPNEPATTPPFRGWTSGLRAFWRFSRVQRYAYAISPEEGWDAFLGVHGSDRALGASFGAFDLSWALATYFRMPWGPYRRHHVLALRLAGGVGTTDRGAPGIFALGGFPTYGLADFIGSLISLSAYSSVGLRGYPVNSRIGSQYHLFNAEYRFLIAQVDRGVITLPVFLSRIYASAFVDVGNAFFGGFRWQDLAVGVGAEVLIDVTFGYVLANTIRVGVAQGLVGDDAMTQFYALLSSPF